VLRCAAEYIVIDVDQRKLPAAERGVKEQLPAGCRRQADDDSSDSTVKHWRLIESLAWAYRNVVRRDY